MANKDVYEPYRNRLSELTAKRDAIYERIGPVQKELDAVNEEIAKLQVRQQELVDEKQRLFGGQSWLDLKKEIAALSRLLSRKSH